MRSSSKKFAGILVSHWMSILLNKHYKFRLYVVMFLLRNQISWRQCSITISPFILPYYGFGAKYIFSFLFYNSNSCPYNVWICAEWDLCWFWVWATNLGLVCRLVNVGNVIWLVIAFLLKSFILSCCCIFVSLIYLIVIWFSLAITHGIPFAIFPHSPPFSSP